MKAAIFTVAAIIGFIGCNREAKRDAEGTSGEAAQSAAEKTEEEARQTGRDIGELFAGDKGKTDADKALTSRIRTALKNDKAAAKEASDINIDTENGVVRLTGTVATADDKKEIARVAGTAAGTAKVRDEIKVAERVGAGSND